MIEAVMGAVVLFIAGFFLVFAYNSSKSTLVKGYNLIAKFDRIDGLNSGADVRLGGVKVGSILTSSVDSHTYQAIVTFSVQNDIKLPKDTSAEIASESFMGGKYLALVPGGSADVLKANEEISLTQSSVSIEGLLSKFLFNSKSEEGTKK